MFPYCFCNIVKNLLCTQKRAHCTTLDEGPVAPGTSRDRPKSLAITKDHSLSLGSDFEPDLKPKTKAKTKFINKLIESSMDLGSDIEEIKTKVSLAKSRFVGPKPESSIDLESDTESVPPPKPRVAHKLKQAVKNKFIGDLSESSVDLGSDFDVPKASNKKAFGKKPLPKRELMTDDSETCGPTIKSQKSSSKKPSLVGCQESSMDFDELDEDTPMKGNGIGSKLQEVKRGISAKAQPIQAAWAERKNSLGSILSFESNNDPGEKAAPPAGTACSSGSSRRLSRKSIDSEDFMTADEEPLEESPAKQAKTETVAEPVPPLRAPLRPVPPAKEDLARSANQCHQEEWSIDESEDNTVVDQPPPLPLPHVLFSLDAVALLMCCALCCH